MPAATAGHRPHGVRAHSQRYWSNSKGSLRGKPQLRVLKQLVTEQLVTNKNPLKHLLQTTPSQPFIHHLQRICRLAGTFKPCLRMRSCYF